MAARRHDIDKRLCGESLAVQRLQIHVGPGQAGIKCRVDATDHRRQMRGEDDRYSCFADAVQPLHDFRMVAVTAYAVCLEVI